MTRFAEDTVRSYTLKIQNFLDYLEETGKDQPAEVWVAAAEAGDEEAKGVLFRHHRRLAKALAAVINLMDPHVIVLGGGVSNIASVYDVVPQLWQEWVFSDSVVTPLRKSDAPGPFFNFKM